MELVTDLSHLKERAVVDYYRTMVEGASPLFASWLRFKKLVPETLGAFLSFSTPVSKISFLPEGEPQPTDEIEAGFERQLALARSVWESEKERALAIIASDPALNRNKYRKGSELKMAAEAEGLFSGNIPFGDLKNLEKLSLKTLISACKKGKMVEENPLFTQMDDLVDALGLLKEAFDANHRAHRIALAHYVEERMEKEKHRASIMGFDDLLSNVAEALHGERGPELASRVGERFQAALIDEFQDTDPQQYFIFARLFGGGQGKTLFMIGDPKQAIYGFRGADIFAYLHAAGEAQKGYTLDTNWRSTDAMVRGVNTLFKRGESPFLFDAIEFQPVGSAGKADEKPLTVDGKTLPAMVMPRFESEGKPLSREKAETLCITICATKMAELLKLGREGRAKLGDESLSEKDLAVIVRTNNQARAVKERLTQLGIHAVLYSSGNIFDSEEAEELVRLLGACLRPWRLHLIRGALATAMLGLDASEIEALDENPKELDRWTLAFTECHTLWQERGFMPMFRRLLAEFGVEERLIRLTEGERRLTNLSHLTGLLHRESVEKKRQPEALLRWLQRMMDPSSPRLEEHQLQLESDRRAVQIVTIHKSKGLEYPVVFLPFPYMGYRKPDDRALCHAPEGGMLCDLGSEDFEIHLEKATNESLAEELRLLYVALTRARCHLLFPWGPVSGWERSAMAKLLQVPEAQGAPQLVSAMKGMGNEAVSDVLETLAAQDAGAFETFLVDPDGDAQALGFLEEELNLSPARRIETPLAEPQIITSFSGLVASGKESREADYDAWTPRPTVDDTPAEGIFAFPKGAGPGTFMHTVFETVPFDADEPTRKAICGDLLTRHGFDAEIWEESMATMVADVMHAPMTDAETPFTLSEVTPEMRLHEMEFTFPLKRITPGELESVLSTWGYGIQKTGEVMMEGLSFSPLKGYLKGYIDLIFCVNGRYGVLDWKSNHLGNSCEKYDTKALTEAMESHRYTLQFLLYTVALCRHLKLKLGDAFDYDTHMAGCWYLFVRGVDEKGHGVYFNRPEKGCIEALDELLIA